MEPTILQRPDHSVSRKKISRNALNVLYRLNEKGYRGYLAGGCVRDLMLGRQPKDFDVATDATPQQVKRCFRNSRIIGRRFRLVHVMFQGEVIEVATFRAPATSPPDEDVLGDEPGAEPGAEPGDKPPEVNGNEVNGNEANGNIRVNEDGVVVRDNEYGTPEEDAFRRDFTINALFYNIEDFSILDYVGGLEDLERRVVHCIGDPDQRYQEDPVRMIRAVRFASTLDLDIEDHTYQAILRQRDQMLHASHARMYEEILKFLYSGGMESAFKAWRKTGLLDVMFPGFAEWVRDEASEAELAWLESALRQLDKWKSHDIKASPELAYTLLLCPYIRHVRDRLRGGGGDQKDLTPRSATLEAVEEVQRVLSDRILIPRKTAYRIFDLLQSQQRFADRRSEQRISRFLSRPYFRDALVLFKFDALAGGTGRADLIAAWSEDLKKAPPPRERKERPHHRGRKRRRRRRTHS